MVNVGILINAMINAGPCNVVSTLFNNYDRKRIRYFLITLYDKNDKKIIDHVKAKGVVVFELNRKRGIKSINNSISQINKIIKEQQIDIIHSHTLVSDYIVKKCKNVVKISTIHNRINEEYATQFGKLKGILLSILHRKILKKMDKCVCCSYSVELNEKKYLRNLCVIQNGVDINNNRKEAICGINMRNKLNINNNAFVFIFVGSLSKRKNVEKLIEEFKKCRSDEDYLLILGDGPERNKILSLADEKIKVLGFVDNPGDYYSISNVYISASLSEGLSMAQLESLSYGLFQCVSDIPSHLEVVDNEQGIYVGEHFNYSNFSKKYNRLKDKMQMSTKDKIVLFFEENFSGKSMMEKYECLYDNVVKYGD